MVARGALMAGRQIDVNLSVNDSGGTLKKRNEEAKQLNQNLSRAAQMAEKAIKAPAARRQAETGEGMEYNRARGAMGGTGAEARDFANQAQGLGGLVRLYATYAANIFAVSAAFNALRQAEATTMMVQGMDKLGAASGMALGGIAKQLVMVTDGTISLREAMEATTKATAAGLSKDQLLELGKVAKGASQALGVNMSDAISRLSRGITKLEPELLDELGLFTKVGKAAEIYARSVNKSVDSLTDFEKRQAFANEVLKEGRDKFGELAAQANPYDKLLANLSNVAQKILEIINVGLKPLVNLFAENTGLIAAAIAIVAAKIFQQAIPAITSWRDNISKAAKASAEAASDLKVTFGENVVGRLTKQFDVDKLDRDLKKANTSYDSAVKRFIDTDNNYKGKSAILEALRSGQQLTTRQLSTLQADANKRMNEGSEANVRHAKTALAVVEAQKERARLTKINIQADEALYGQTKRGSEEWQRESIARQRLAKAERLELLSGVGGEVEKKGFGAGLTSFYSEVDSSKNLGRWDKLKTKAVGTLVGISTAAGIAMQAFGPLMWVIEAAVAVFLIFDSVLSSNSKQVDEFKGAISGLEESTKTAINTNDKFANSIATSQAIIARGTALNALTEDILKLINTLAEADKYASWWDKFFDGFKRPIGMDLQSQFSKNVDKALNASLKVVPEGPLKKQLEEKLKNSLGTLNFQEAFAGMRQEDIVDKSKEVQKIVAEVQKIVDKSRILAENVRETNKASETSFLNFQNAVFRPTQMQTFLMDTTKNVLALRDAFNDSLNAPAEFKNILDGVTKLEFFSPDVANSLLNITSQFKALADPIEKQRTALADAKQRLKEVTKEYDSATMGSQKYWKAVGEKGRLERLIPNLESDIAQAINRNQPLMERLGKIAAETMGKQIQISIDKSLEETSLRLKQIDIASKKTALQALPRQTEEVIDERVRLEREGIKVESQLRKVQENLISSIDLLRVELEIGRLKVEREGISSQFAMDGRARAEALRVQDQRIERAEKKKSALETSDIQTLRSLAIDNPDVQAMINRITNRQVEQAATNAKLAEASFKGQLDKIALKAAQDTDKLQADIKLLQAQAKPKVPEELAKFEADQAIQVQGIQEQIRQVQLFAAQQRADAARQAGAAGVSTQSVKLLLAQEQERASALQEQLNFTENQNNAIAVQVAQYEATIARLKEIQTTNKAVADAEFNDRSAAIESAKTQLSLDQENYRATADQIAQRQFSITVKEAELDRDRKLYEVQQQTAISVLEWRKKLAAQNDILSADLRAEINGILERGAVSQSEAQKELSRRVQLATLVKDNTMQQAQMARDIGKVFEGVTDKMTDAFMKFAETGKLNFKDLANSVIADIARIIIKMQTMKILESMFGKGWEGNAGSWIAKIVGSLGKTAGPNYTAADMAMMAGMAKGGAFESGVQKFGKGGMFTNKIVTEPTLFKFAKGAGMMGEAGPEAIMPLKRDNSGSLGVAVNGNAQPKVDVVVNNFSGEKAETKETVDSRGNRKIEVVIGEMVAGEMGRKNSPVQQSMMANFMTRPATVRR